MKCPFQAQKINDNILAPAEDLNWGVKPGNETWKGSSLVALFGADRGNGTNKFGFTAQSSLKDQHSKKLGAGAQRVRAFLLRALCDSRTHEECRVF